MKNYFLIINYNDAEVTATLVNSIRDYSCLDIVLVVDNGSTDDSMHRLKQLTDQRVRVLSNPRNGGYSAGINFGINFLIEQGYEGNIVISNSDIIIKDEADLLALFKVLDQDASIGMIGPTIIEQGNKNRGWKIPSPMADVAMNLPLIHRWIRKKAILYPEKHYEDTLSLVEVISGGFFVSRIDSLKQIGLLDEKVFLYYEENILAVKFKQQNKKIIVHNRVSVIHNHSVTIDKALSRLNKLKQLKKSQYYFQTVYNQAGFISRGLLKASSKLAILLLKGYYLKEER